MGAGGKEPIIGPLQPGWAPNILDYVCSDEDDMNWAEAKARQQRGLRIERSFELRQLGHWNMQWLTKMTITTHDDQDDNQYDKIVTTNAVGIFYATRNGENLSPQIHCSG